MQRFFTTLFTLSLLVVFTAQAQTTINGSLSGMAGYGGAISVSGNDVVVGEVGLRGPANANRSGAIFVHTRNADGTWMETSILRSSNGTAGDNFGRALDIRGDVILAGATSANGGQGGAYIFTRGADGTSPGALALKKRIGASRRAMHYNGDLGQV